jgi:hypothetical protein
VSLNVGFWGQSGHGSVMTLCLLMTDAVEKAVDDLTKPFRGSF